MRAAFRKLGTLTLMAWGFLFSILSFAASERYSNAHDPTKLYSTIESACLAGDVSRLSPNLINPRFTGEYVKSSWYFSCVAEFGYHPYDDPTYPLITTKSSSFLIVKQAESCLSGQSQEFVFSGTVALISGVPTAITNAPSEYCSNACSYGRASNQHSCTINGEKSFCSYTYESTGQNCSFSNDTGDTDSDTGGTGGDTDGGDSGGGDSGGDSGGGDTGGGDSGGDSGGTDSTMWCHSYSRVLR